MWQPRFFKKLLTATNFPFHLANTILKGGFTPLSASHKKGVFRFKTVFLGESQRPVRRLYNQISSFGLETH